jgi:hypothetical protein
MRELPLQLEIELTERVGLLVACFPQPPIGDEMVKAYVRWLADIPLEVLDAVIEQAVAEYKFLPTIAELREIVLRLSSVSGRRPNAAEAWGDVMAEVRRVGSYRQPVFSDELVARAVEIIGWRELCLSENGVADRAHFFRVYEQLVRREAEEERLLPEARRLRALTAEMAGRMRLPGAATDANNLVTFKARDEQESEHESAA